MKLPSHLPIFHHSLSGQSLNEIEIRVWDFMQQRLLCWCLVSFNDLLAIGSFSRYDHGVHFLPSLPSSSPSGHFGTCRASRASRFVPLRLRRWPPEDDFET